jgi:opacity protein-like surface antigen
MHQEGERNMKKLLMTVLVSALFATVAAAQEFPRFELFGGYSLLRLGGDEINEFIDDVETEVELSDITFRGTNWLKRGFNASAAININEYFGIQVLFMNNRGIVIDLSSLVDQASERLRATDYSLLAGPRFALRRHEAITPFAHVLFGMNRTDLDGQFTDGPGELEDVNVTLFSEKGFAIGFGGGVDLNIHRNVAVRLIQVDYIRAIHDSGFRGFNDFTAKNLNLAFGLVFKLGN